MRSLLVVLLLSMLGCASTQNKIISDITISQLDNFNNCGPLKSGQLVEVADKVELNDLLSHFQMSQNKLELVLPTTNFKENRYFIYSRGQVANPGYGLNLSEDFIVKDGKISIEIIHTSPAPDMMYAQIVQSPCILIEVTNANGKQINIQKN